MTESDATPSVAVPRAGVAASPSSATVPSLLGTWLRMARKNKIGVASGVVLVLLAAVTILAPWISPYDPNKLQYGHPLESPSSSFWFGTDHIGRDVFSRIIWGARKSLLIAVLAVSIGVVSGSLIGTVSAWYGGWPDLIVQRFVDALQAIPGLLVAMVVATVLAPSVWTISLAIGINFIPGGSRICRSVVLSLREAQFMLAARSIGSSDARLILRHVLPNLASPVAVVASGALAGAILSETSLSFLGLGLQPPDPTWGSMVGREGRQYMEQAPWILFSASGAVSLTVLSAALFGDAMRDMLDPRVRRRK